MTEKIRFVAKAHKDGSRLLVLDGSAPIDRARAQSFSRAYVDFIAQLNASNACRDWWAYSFTGKSPLSSRLPERCFYLSLIVAEAEALNGETLCVVSTDDVLAGQVRLWAHEKGIGFEQPARRRWGLKSTVNALTPLGPVVGFLRSLWHWLQARSRCRFNPDPKREYCVFATLINQQSFDPSGGYRDIFFGDLPSRMEERKAEPLIFGSIIGPFSTHLLRLTRSRCQVPVIPMDYFLSWRDLWDCFLNSLYRRWNEFPLRLTDRLKGLDVSFLIKEDMRRNCRESRFFSDLWYQACAQALLRELKVKTLYYPFENLSRERMLVLAFRSLSPQTRLVGYQHATLTPAHLNFMLGKNEAAILPLPDAVVTMGEVTRDFMIERGGFLPSLLRAGCGLRQRPVTRSCQLSREAGNGRPLRLLVALATSPEESAGVLRLLDQTFPASPDQPTITLRPHPVIPLSWGLKISGPVRLRFNEDRGPVDMAFSQADVVLYASSTMGLEAVRRGIPVVCLDLGIFLNPDPLHDLTSLKWAARDPESLRRALRAISSLPEREMELMRRRAGEYAARYCPAASPPRLEPFYDEPTLAR